MIQFMVANVAWCFTFIYAYGTIGKIYVMSIMLLQVLEFSWTLTIATLIMNGSIKKFNTSLINLMNQSLLDWSMNRLCQSICRQC